MCYIALTFLWIRFVELILSVSYSWAFIYKNTPAITVIVPNPLKAVIGLPNISTESQMRNALFAVFATLK